MVLVLVLALVLQGGTVALLAQPAQRARKVAVVKKQRGMRLQFCVPHAAHRANQVHVGRPRSTRLCFLFLLLLCSCRSGLLSVRQGG